MPKPLFDADAPTSQQTPLVNQAFVQTWEAPSAVAVVKPATATAIAVVTDEEIERLGAERASQVGTITQQILSSVRASDTDQFGSKLNEIVATAKQLDPNKIGGGGMFGAIKNLFGNTKEKLFATYQTVEQRMDALVKELDSTTQLMLKRVGDLEQMYIENEQLYHYYGAEAQKAADMYASMQTYMQSLPPAADGFEAQQRADLQARAMRLEKKIDDLKRFQQLVLLAAPEIRQSQDHNRALAANFVDIKNTTIPAWKQVFSRYILQMETKKAAELSTSIQDATDQAFRMQADMHRQTAVEVAKTTQRSVVSTETLIHMQEQLFAAVDDTQRIVEDSRRARKDAAPKLQTLETELIKRFSTK